MKFFEIEQKYRIATPNRIRKKLQALGAKRISSGKESNILFDARKMLRSKKSILRLRRGANGKASLTFKGPRLKGRFKKRIEVEMPVEYKITKTILGWIGFRKVLEYSKRREEFIMKKAHIALDYLSGKGWFLEIEASPRDIHAVAKKLGLNSKDEEPRSYLQILGLTKRD